MSQNHDQNRPTPSQPWYDNGQVPQSKKFPFGAGNGNGGDESATRMNPQIDQNGQGNTLPTDSSRPTAPRRHRSTATARTSAAPLRAASRMETVSSTAVRPRAASLITTASSTAMVSSSEAPRRADRTMVRPSLPTSPTPQTVRAARGSRSISRSRISIRRRTMASRRVVSRNPVSRRAARVSSTETIRSRAASRSTVRTVPASTASSIPTSSREASPAPASMVSPSRVSRSPVSRRVRRRTAVRIR